MEIPKEFKGHYKVRIYDVKPCDPVYTEDSETGERIEWVMLDIPRYQVQYCGLNKKYPSLREKAKVITEFEGVNLEFIFGPLTPNLGLALGLKKLEDLSSKKLEEIIQQLIVEKAYYSSDKIREVVDRVLSAE